jgi:hypothetical protein
MIDDRNPGPTENIVSAQDMPFELGEIALTAFTESLKILSDNEHEPVLPVGI